MKYILIVFKDGSFALVPKANLYSAKDYQKGTTFFETDENTTIDNLSSFIAGSFKSNAKFQKIAIINKY